MYLKRRLVALSIIITITALIGSLVLLLRSQGDAAYGMTRLIREEPQRYTELYFDDHLQLPTVVAPHEKQSFQFTIRNVEHAPMKYTYEVSASTPDERRVLAQKELSLESDQAITIKQDFILDRPYDRVRLDVTLLDTGQAIAFWLQRS